MDCTLSSSMFAGLAIGSEMSGGIRDVRVENCLISGRQNGIFIKSREGRGGFIENIVGENLTVNNSPTFLTIRLLKTGIQASEPVPGRVEKWARIHNISFHNIKVNNVDQLVNAQDIPHSNDRWMVCRWTILPALVEMEFRWPTSSM